MDLVATGTNKKIVERDVINLIKSQVIFALDHDNMDNIFKPAPKEIWEMISHSKKCELKRIRLFAPDRDVNKRKPDHIPPIKEVEFCFA
ncbi:MAG: hypothetical protein D6726_08040 [Nitrospirae bacterium]|nr:MAG: hypothetical protein D6726_08040 [Nitrospirota bacterium]